MHTFTAHNPEARRYFAHLNLPTHPLCWLRGHRAKAEVQEPGFNIDPWILVTCRTCGMRHRDPYMTGGKFVTIEADKKAAAKKALARQVEAARSNNTAYARVRDGRDGYGHHELSLSLEVSHRAGFRKPGIRLHIGDRWSETPFDGSIHTRSRAAYFSVGGVGNRFAHWLTKGQKRDISIGAAYKEVI